MISAHIRQAQAADPVTNSGRAHIGVMSIGEAHGLTSCEQAVFDLMLHGESGRDIARQLQISETAVRARYRSILRKLNARNGSEIVERVWQWELAVSRLLKEPQFRAPDQGRSEEPSVCPDASRSALHR